MPAFQAVVASLVEDVAAVAATGLRAAGYAVLSGPFRNPLG
jgi:hypothetical protein